MLEVKRIWVHFDAYESRTRNSSGDEIAKVNFLYDDIVHAVQYRPTINLCINSATDRRGGCGGTQVYQIQ